jgi:hypothetical protein
VIKFPPTVTILSQEYTILTVPRTHPKLEGAHGTVSFQTLEIFLAEDMTGDFMRETLLHEILHIIDYCSAGAANQLKERDIQRMSAIVFDTFKNNPLLVKRVFKIH